MYVTYTKLKKRKCVALRFFIISHQLLSFFLSFTISSDVLPICACVCVCIKCMDISEMVNDADDILFHKIFYDAMFYQIRLLPERRIELTYSLRTRRHDRTLSQRATRLTDNNFIIRVL